MENEIKPIGSTDISAMGAVVENLMTDLRQIIDEARIHVASTANYELTMMYWHIGERINRVVLGNERATYGKQIVPQVATQLPPRDVLIQQIQKSLEVAKAKWGYEGKEEEV